MYEALVHCIEGAPWNPIDHLANVHDAILIREAADEDPERLWAFTVNHYRMEDRIWADVEAATAPDEHGSIRVTVLHAGVVPGERCQQCGSTCGNGKGSDFLPSYAQPDFTKAQKLGALV